MKNESKQTTEKENRAQGHTFLKKLIIGKVILLGVMGGIAYYLFQTI